ncbi:MAG: hypothetical protein CMJ50_05035 [Planctomycetaceae bacterium]|nr:hypothetical protein [Planctomycetaceae bacterium]
MVAAIILLVFGQRTMIGAEREVDPPAVVPQASVADHFVIGQRQLVAVDLLRGRRVWGLAVRRTWRPTMARSKHFGPGWSDSNDVQIVKLADQKLSVWRGGLLLTIARRADDSSEDAPGHRIVHDADGWAMQFNDDVLRFRDDGKLTLWKSPARDLTFHYDDQARLARVQASDAQFLNYHYDEDRVIRIEGPKSLIARYEYDGEGRLAQVVNGWNRRTRYSYSDDRMQVVATDDSGRRTASPEFIVAGVDTGELPEAQTSEAAPTARRLSSAAGDSTEVDELGRVTAVTLPSGNVVADVVLEQLVFSDESAEGCERDLVGSQESFFDTEAIDGGLVVSLLMEVRQGTVDRFEHFLGRHFASLPFVGSRVAVHRGDTVVLVAVVPSLDGPPSETVLLALFIEKRHLRDVLDSLVTGFTFDDFNRAEHLHLYVDRWSLHGSLLSKRGTGNV